MSYAVQVENNVVTQVGILAQGQSVPDGWVQSDTLVGIGYSYANGGFFPPAAATPSPEEVVAAEIEELKQKLRDTDYVALPDYDQDKPDVLANRQAWREAIRTLEGS
jgi:hypothetical protein